MGTTGEERGGGGTGKREGTERKERKRKEGLKEDFHVKAFNQKFSNLGGSLN